MGYVIDLHLFSKKLCSIMKKKKLTDKKGNPCPISLYNMLYPNDIITEAELKEDRQKATDKTRNIRNWINGKNYPKNISDILRLCNALEVDLDYLFTDMKCKTHDIQYISDKTGLSEDAINSLSYAKSIKSKRVSNAINILICNLFEKPKKESKLSFFELFANYLHFSGCDSEYYVSSKGEISPAEPYTAANGKKYHPTNKLLFYSNQLEQMYIMEIEDELKSIKKNMNKAPGTD